MTTSIAQHEQLGPAGCNCYPLLSGDLPLEDEQKLKASVPCHLKMTLLIVEQSTYFELQHSYKGPS